MTNRLNGISAFVEAAEAGSFALAAERMRLTRSAVGKSISRLEQRLGVRLFQRTTRSQSLTDEGQAYYERCVRALAELDAGALALDSGKGEPVGRLRISVPVLFGRHCVAPVLLALGRRYPRLVMEMSFNDRVVDLVEEGYDLAVRIGNLPDSSSLAARRLAAQRMVICAAPRYLDACGKPAGLDELSGHIGIAYGRSGRIQPWRVSDAGGQALKPQVDIRYVFDDLQAIADAAVAGMGLAWLPCWLMANSARAGELAIVMDCDTMQAADIYAVWPRSHYLPTKTRAAIDALVAEIPGRIGHFEQVLGGASQN
ncbi:LysR family transcriptional regulator [Candidatus Methylospira mobilis]|uniref:LysR family transcriptional regulator n=1 Tax=Candidatus Methylospira mobilis TaxID=1808979 RepID=A0A5Q0BP96_9GAMM|nr:LysR family transcriptional regulator [Candidatus Methylospira mobilis]QFY44014.1 LysR family transcriptional regulator [Candidatus Methylospira mobilis]WNV05021.1 LysR family transcriptional regulator [Candidatus Methylospira mobilis]